MSTNDVPKDLTGKAREELRQAFESAISAKEKLKLLEKMLESGFEAKDLGSEYEQLVATAYGGGGEEAIEALTAVISHGDLHPGVRATALVYKAIANFEMRKFYDAKEDLKICQNILEELVVDDANSLSPETVAARFVEVSVLYQEMDDPEKAIYFARRVLAVPEISIESLEKGSGRLALLLVQYGKAEQGIFYSELENVMKKLDNFGPEQSGLGYAYERLGRAYIPKRLDLAAKCLEYAKSIMDATLGPQHLDTLKTSQALSLAYTKSGRFSLAIEIQEKVFEALRGLGSSAKERFEEAKGILDLIMSTKANFEDMLGSSPGFGVSDLVCMLDDIVESGMLDDAEESGDGEL